MAKPDDISSTERLLNVIRNTAPVNEASVIKSSAPDRKLLHITDKFFKKTAHSVGVHMDGGYLHLVKVGHRLDKKPVVLDFHSASFPPEVADSRDRTIDLLRSELSPFCPLSPPATVWTVLSLEETDIRSLRIPKVTKSKLENAVYWTLQKEAAFDAGKTLLDFRILGDIVDNGVAKTEVVVCTAPRAKVDDITALFRAAGVALTGVVAPAFSVQNFFKTGWLGVEENLACSLLIDFNWSRIDIFRPNGDLIVSRGIKAGIASMVESIKSEGIRPTEDHTLADTADETASVLELPAFDTEEADQILQILNRDTAIPSSAGAGLLKSDDVFDMVLPALERLVRQVERTLEHVTLRFSDGPIERLFISGPISSYPRLVNHISSQLGLPLEIVDPFSSISAGVKPPEDIGKRASYVSAAGLALSGSGHPPNFLFTHKETALRRRKIRLHQIMFLLFLVGVTAIWSNHVFQKRHIHDLEKKLYQHQLTETEENGKNDRASLLALAAQVNKKNRALKVMSKNFLPVGVIGEITTLGTNHIRFLRIEGNNQQPEGTTPDEAKVAVVVDAVVYGQSNEVETRLARYLIALKRSQLFTRVALKKKTIEHLGSDEVLRFSLLLEVV